MLKSKKNGFTLVELIIVMAVLVGMILFVFPKVKHARERANIKKDISVAVNISNEAIILKKQGAVISSDSWNKASDIKVINKDGSEKTLAQCVDAGEKAKAKVVKGCEFYIRLDKEGNVLVAVKEGRGKDQKGEPIESYLQVYPEVYADEPYRSNY